MVKYHIITTKIWLHHHQISTKYRKLPYHKSITTVITLSIWYLFCVWALSTNSFQVWYIYIYDMKWCDIYIYHIYIQYDMTRMTLCMSNMSWRDCLSCWDKRCMWVSVRVGCATPTWCALDHRFWKGSSHVPFISIAPNIHYFKSFNFGSVSSLWESQNSRSASAWSYWPQVDLFAGKLQQSSNSIHRIHRILLHSASFKSERGPDSVHCPSNLEPFNVFYTSIIFYNII